MADGLSGPAVSQHSFSYGRRDGNLSTGQIAMAGASK